MERNDMLRFTRPRALQSDLVKVDQIVGMPRQVAGTPPPAQQVGTDMDIKSPSRSSTLLNSVMEMKRAEGGSYAVAPDPVLPRSPPLSMLPLTEVVWSYFGLCFKGIAPINPYKRNQDAFVVEHDDATDTLLLAVLDGHGEHGDRCAMWAARELAARCFVHPLWPGDPSVTLKVVGSELAAVLGGESSASFADTEFSGTTLTAVAVRAAAIHVLHIGDCRVVLGSEHTMEEVQVSAFAGGGGGGGGERVQGLRRRKGGKGGGLKANPLTVEHRPAVREERRRIVNAGGRVFGVRYDDGSVGCPRLWLPNLDVPGLAVSRSLGDTIGAEFAGLSSEPDEHLVHIEPPPWFEKGDSRSAAQKKKQEQHEKQQGLKPRLVRGDGLLILATDGVWEVMSSQEAVDACCDAAEHHLEKTARDADAARLYDDDFLNQALGGAAKGSHVGDESGGSKSDDPNRWRGEAYVEPGGGQHGLAGVMAQGLVNTAQDRWRASSSARSMGGRSDDTTVVVALLCDYKRR